MTRTFLQHGDAQILFTVRLSAAHDGLPLAFLSRGVAHRQDLDLAVVQLGGQAVKRCKKELY